MLPRVVEGERVPGALPGVLPATRVPIRVRPGTLADVPFMDGLQKLHTRQVGWMPTKQFEGKVKLGHVLIAEDDAARPAGYCIGNDQYFKRDDVGIIYQMNVAPGCQRGYVGATLLKAMFERSAWGCKLFCCWCAQDIAANRFWEAMGFVPLAFRAGSRKRDRIHIFWQKRIRQGDTSTPWWFPAQTGGGSIREDRLVLPIPPGTHWSDAKPMVLPGVPGQEREEEECLAQPAKGAKKERVVAATKPAAMVSVGVRFGAPPAISPAAQAPSEETTIVKREKKAKAPVKKNDPRLVAAARELRDRYLEEVNSGRHALGAALPGGAGKYDVTRALPEAALDTKHRPDPVRGQLPVQEAA